jgi:hypothetical protein
MKLLSVFVTLLALSGVGYAEKTERFDKDPGWEGVNNRPNSPPRRIKQDFGYSPTSHFGGVPGEMGGQLTAAGEPAYYGLKIAPSTFDQPLTASGKITTTGREGHLLLGFFNSNTLNEWRTPNTIAIRLSGRGDVFYAWLEYCTKVWRAGGDTPQGFQKAVPGGRPTQIEFPAKGAVLQWSLRYDPAANNGTGSVTAKLGDHTAVCHLDPGHKQDGAAFDRFGLLTVMKSADGPGDWFLDDVEVNGRTEKFDRDPKWEGRGNRREYDSPEIRPRFDFGFTRTRHAGGKGAGELGGIVYRGDGRYPDKMAWYADPLPQPLSLKAPLRISGRLALRRGVSDSTTLFGFFNSKASTAINPSQDSGFPEGFFGVGIEGPSSEGFLLYPAFRMAGNAYQDYRAAMGNRVRPDGKQHDWSLEYSPTAGKVTVRLDQGVATLAVPPEVVAAGATFDRIGILTTRVDGNGQHVYFDDLTYTVRQ